MREVVKWNKDHLNGELIEKKCFKPDDGLKGTAKIEIFDENGNLKNETYTENIIPNIIDESELYRAMFRTIVNGSGSFNDGKSQPSSFRNIILSSNDREEDENNYKGDVGQIIGWCPKSNTNAGSDTTRGVYNPNESYTEWKDGYYHQHLVYDFSTSQGNGTINSIWWSKGVYNSNDNGGVKMPLFCLSWTLPIGGGRSRHFSNNQFIYTGVNNKYYKYDNSDKTYKRIIDGDMYVQGATTLKLSKTLDDTFTNFIEIPLSLNELPNSNNKYVKISNYDYSVGTKDNFKCSFDLEVRDKHDAILDSVNINLRNIDNIVVTMSRGANSSNKNFKLDRIFRVEENGDVYMAFSCYSGSNDTGSSYAIFPKYDSTNDKILDSSYTERSYNGYLLGVYNIYAKRWTIEPRFNSLQSVRFVGCNALKDVLGKITIGKDDFYYRNNSGNPIIYTTLHKEREYYFNLTSPYIGDISSKNSSTGGWLTAHIYNTNYLLTTRPESTGYNFDDEFKIIPGYSAHTKLPTSVVKTASDTMKIQYDYYIQVPKISTDNDYYLTYKD